MKSSSWSSDPDISGYDTIGAEALYTKLKATEVDYKMRDSLACTEEQLATLGDNELCLVSSRFQRAYDNRMSKKRGERPKCFECGEVSHFIAECPNKNDYYKKGKSYSRYSDKYHSGKSSFDKHRSSKHSFGKRPFGKKNFWKAFKSYQKDNRKRDKAFFAEIGFCSSGFSSSSSSSSSSDEEITYRKDKRNDQGGSVGLCFVSTKSKCKNKDKKNSVCSMALEDKENKDDGGNSSSDDETVVLEDLRFQVLSLQDDNCMLREALSWVYARQPQLEMIIESTKRAEGDTIGFGFGSAAPQVTGWRCVDNALIKGEIESQWTGFITLLC
ncbi:hypothetical protein U9M48_000169 [Paspalum notatum var. saurae]|uniref:CCHC-type domain-containing protein n=1 Tax=Paspalum notatum var. saurae TaxID=547442 RepID=A0AAQ3PGH2_PASNO